MTLPVGKRFGPYEVVSAAGAGGMGEVYRARDTRLGRDVAVKILPEAFSNDAGRLRRFEQEVQVLSALNHPNILGVYDVGEADGMHYFVSELLEGEDLRQRLADGALPLRKAVEFAIQIAHGLAAAHEKGVIHRDLKPENVFITKDGRVKLLDFGLAKPTAAGAVAGNSPTMTVGSEVGTVLGTVGYMSPEQVRGKATDQRSDLFSFGVVLYEMIAGKRAFTGDSSVEVMNAILKSDPPELTSSDRNVPAALDRIIRRCLEKNPEERFQSARDVAFALDAVSGASSTSGAAPALSVNRKWNPWMVAAGVAVLAIAAAIAYVAKSKPTAPVVYKMLTFDSGYVGRARFSRDGNTIIYSAAWNNGPVQLYSQRTNSMVSQSLKLDAEVMGIADNGEMAIILNRRFLASWLQSGTLARLPLEGGTPRPILEDVYAADISRDGQQFAAVRAGDGKQRLEYPIGKVLYTTDGWISDVRISPDGKSVAFLEHSVIPDDRGSVCVVDLKGNLRRLTHEYDGAHGVVWSPDGKEIWNSAAINGDEQQTMAVNMSGKVRTVLTSPIGTQIEDISDAGRVLIESIRFSIELGIKRSQDKVSRMMEAGIVDLGAISSDGDWLVYNRSNGPNYDVFLRKSDGSPAALLGEGYGAGITLDGRWIAAFTLADHHKFILYPAGAGEKREFNLGQLDVTVSGLENGVTFTRDGHFAYFTALDAQKVIRGYLMDVSNGSYRPVTPAGIRGGRLSPNGTRVVATDVSTLKYVLVDVASGKVSEVAGIGAHEEVSGWSEDGKSLMIWDTEMPLKIFNLDLATGKRRHVQTVEPVAGLGSMYARLLTCGDGSVAVYRLRRGLYGVYLADGLK